MKRFLILAAAATIALSACAQNNSKNTTAAQNAPQTIANQQTQSGIKWENGTLMDALKKAKESGKELVFLDCYATWCGPCKYMANEVFTTKEAGDYFNKKFVNIKIDMEKGEGIGLARELRIQGYPTFVILNSNGKELGRIVGGAQIGQFIKKVEEVLSKNK